MNIFIYFLIIPETFSLQQKNNSSDDDETEMYITGISAFVSEKLPLKTRPPAATIGSLPVRSREEDEEGEMYIIGVDAKHKQKVFFFFFFLLNNKN